MDLFFWTFYRYATQGVASEARRGPLIVPHMVLKYSLGPCFRDFEASGSPGLARSDLAVPNQGLRRGAFATRHKPLDRQSFQRIGDNCRLVTLAPMKSQAFSRFCLALMMRSLCTCTAPQFRRTDLPAT